MDIKGHMAVLIGTDAQMDGIAALMTAEAHGTKKLKGERDTEFVKRIARTYNNFALRGLLAKLEATNER